MHRLGQGQREMETLRKERDWGTEINRYGGKKRREKTSLEK